MEDKYFVFDAKNNYLETFDTQEKAIAYVTSELDEGDVSTEDFFVFFGKRVKVSLSLELVNE